MAARPTVASGVLEIFTQNGITEPKTAFELLALELADRIDRGVDDRSLAGISAQLTRTIEQVLLQPSPKASNVDEIIERQ
jgi:hypothetical protein